LRRPSAFGEGSVALLLPPPPEEGGSPSSYRLKAGRVRTRLAWTSWDKASD